MAFNEQMNLGKWDICAERQYARFQVKTLKLYHRHLVTLKFNSCLVTVA